MTKGVGHFTDTSIWNGNVCLAAHNRGTNSYFGKIHTLSIGDSITLTTKEGTRTYSVTSVEKVSFTFPPSAFTAEISIISSVFGLNPVVSRSNTT